MIDAETRKNGKERVLDLLRDRRPHTTAEIEEACQVDCRARISDLKKDGHMIVRESNPGGTGRRSYTYKLVATSDELRVAQLVATSDELRVARATSSTLGGATRTPENRVAPPSDDERSSEPNAPCATGSTSGGAFNSPASPEVKNPHDFEDRLDELEGVDVYFEQLQIGAAV